MKRYLERAICLYVTLATVVLAVDRGNFKTCDQSSFCKRHRAVPDDQSPYSILPHSIVVMATSVEMQLLNSQTNVVLQLRLYGLDDSTVRLKVTEATGVKPRFEIPVGDVLVAEPKQQSIKVDQRDNNKVVVSLQDGRLIIQMSPFRIDFVVDGEPVISVNGRGLLMFEHLREKSRPKRAVEENAENKEPPAEGDEEKKEGDEEVKKEEEQEDDDDDAVGEEPGMWEETFKSHHDSKPHGPSSVGLDFSFPGYEFVYGIPEHADTLPLKSTKSSEPYRLYNLDVFEYELYNPMALYGSVPFMLAHNEKRTVGLFWQNAAETWIDVNSNTADKNMLSKLVDFVKGDAEIPQIDTHWFSESGIIDVFFLLGPKPADVFRQYAKLTGTTPLPPLFALAYHQSRWNYNDEADVASIDAGFDEHDIPLDVIWLDIEHTDGKRYFTWDSHKFPNPEEMIKNVSAKGRKMVTIVDPHLKRDDGFHVYKEAQDQGYLVKNKDGSNYDGWCWPGSSGWPDFVDPKIRRYWASKFLPSEYKGSTPDLYTWNDMNEPSVFNGPEITMHKDAKHYGGWEHRDVHNIYGLYVHQSTVEGQLLRSDYKERPFVLSRAFFAGSQRCGAVWTGDNTGEWSHLKISLPMVMSLNLVGITLSGADVGGFFKNPDSELLTRWYQTAIFQPFFRAHAHIDTRRREPWLLQPEHTQAIREAIRLRYRMLPYWYTLFFNAERDGGPVMKPLWVEFPADKATFNVEDEHLLGSAVLVHPIVDAGVAGLNVFLPGKDEVWYKYDNYQRLPGGTNFYVTADINTIPMFYRGGYVIPLHERVRRASSLAVHDPYTLIVALDTKGYSRGDLYHDDFHTFQYKAGQYVHREFTFDNKKLSSRNLNEKRNDYETEAWIERVVIVGIATPAKQVLLTSPGLTMPVQLDSTFNDKQKTLTIRKPGVKISADFEITLK